jgi:LysM repeat protein
MKIKFKPGLLVSLALLMTFAASVGGAAAAPAADGPNLLVNPGFEAPLVFQCCRTDLPADKPPTVIDEIQVAHGWTAWWQEPDANHPSSGPAPTWHRPEYRAAYCGWWICDPRVHSGADAQKYFTFFSVHEAGVYQQVSGITPGSLLEFSIYMEAWSTHENTGPSMLTQNMGMRIGIDPFGGTNPWSGNIIWTEPFDSFDAWHLYTLRAAAQNSTVTVFTRSKPFYGFQHNDVYLDDASLVVVGAGSGSGSGTGSGVQPPAPTPVPVAGPGGSYVVQPGDILTRIAFRFGVTVDDIIIANKISNPNLLSVGQLLIIPGVTVEGGSGGDPAPGPTPITGSISYEVVAGDSLWRLSDVFGVTIARIKQLNNLKSDTIYIGQILTIAP